MRKQKSILRHRVETHKQNSNEKLYPYNHVFVTDRKIFKGKFSARVIFNSKYCIKFNSIPNSIQFNSIPNHPFKQFLSVSESSSALLTWFMAADLLYFGKLFLLWNLICTQVYHLSSSKVHQNLFSTVGYLHRLGRITMFYPIQV